MDLTIDHSQSSNAANLGISSLRRLAHEAGEQLNTPAGDLL